MPMRKTTALLPDVQIYAKGSGRCLEVPRILRKDEIAKAKNLLKEGQERPISLRPAKRPGPRKRGLVARGYVSRIDGSVQPYGLIVPQSYDPAGGKKYRLDIWFHGRGENLSELNFISEREKQTARSLRPIRSSCTRRPLLAMPSSRRRGRRP